MRRPSLLAVLWAFTAWLALPAAAADSYRIALLLSAEGEPYETTERALLAAVEQASQLSGRTIEWDRAVLGSGRDAASAALRDLLDHPVDLLITFGTPATEAAVRSARDLPLLATLLIDPASLGGAGNATAVLLDFPHEVQLRWLHRIVPGARRPGVLYSEERNAVVLSSAATAAAQLGLQLTAIRVETPRDLPAALQRASREADLLWGIPDGVVFSPQSAQGLLKFSLERRVPLAGLSLPWVKAGALYALDRDYQDLGVQCGELVERILSGTPPQSIPPQSPRTVIYGVNRLVADRLGVRVPADVLAAATLVVP